mmetsp:Transcript_25467/g.53026  ORF Transcript_25467/g.53026 Transcript_25467/m.53026 type:complete len:284 (+) Transcript_25467:3-854(+)
MSQWGRFQNLTPPEPWWPFATQSIHSALCRVRRAAQVTLYSESRHGNADHSYYKPCLTTACCSGSWLVTVQHLLIHTAQRVPLAERGPAGIVAVLHPRGPGQLVVPLAVSLSRVNAENLQLLWGAQQRRALADGRRLRCGSRIGGRHQGTALTAGGEEDCRTRVFSGNIHVVEGDFAEGDVHNGWAVAPQPEGKELRETGESLVQAGRDAGHGLTRGAQPERCGSVGVNLPDFEVREVDFDLRELNRVPIYVVHGVARLYVERKEVRVFKVVIFRITIRWNIL